MSSTAESDDCDSQRSHQTYVSMRCVFKNQKLTSKTLCHCGFSGRTLAGAWFVESE